MRTHLLPQQKEQLSAPAVTPALSVIICTYNRRDMALTALASLCRQTLAPEQYEVIVVDNASTDNTMQTLLAYIRRRVALYQSGPSIRCLQETRNGLAFARQRGLQAAAGRITVFLADDTLADPAFLERLLAAYETSNAAAISGRVELYWEARRPYWLTDDLLDLLGYFAPGRARMPLQAPLNLSSCCFSVRTAILREVGLPSPVLSKRFNAPAHIAVEELSRLLRQAGHTLWYEPAALVLHRVPAARLKQAFFVGRAYWRGKAEVLAEHLTSPIQQVCMPWTFSRVLQAIRPTLSAIAHITLFDLPLLAIARRPEHERLLLQMERAHLWGSLQQRLELMERPLSEMQDISVMLIHAGSRHAEMLAQKLRSLGIHCITGKAELSLAWLWRHRIYLGQSIALLHLYRAGDFQLPFWRRLHFGLLLWLARLLGVRVVSTDAGGWWQHIPRLRYLARRSFERMVFAASDVVLASTPHAKQLYPDQFVQARVRYLPHPGLRGYARPVARKQALTLLGLPEQTRCTFLCLANMHTEQEVLHLVTSFTRMQQRRWQAAFAGDREEGETEADLPQLLIVGSPRDCTHSRRLLRQAALNSSIHLFLESGGYQEISDDDLPLCIGAANTLVLPYGACPQAGIPEIAIFFYSYGRTIVAPALPRFRDILPEKACLLYDPHDDTALELALHRARRAHYRLTDQEKEALTLEVSWSRYARRVLAIYHNLFAGTN
ncbi:MAG: glycosyltransferase [Ktedonobacteraceae bacterium]|nr:glycosyltransferase [Ktedonobacteraceae bacterium]